MPLRPRGLAGFGKGETQMRMIAAVVTVLGLGLAGFGAFKTSQYITTTKAREQAALKRIVPTVEVFVAKQDLPFGHELKPDDVVKVAWPKAAVPETAFQDPAVLFPENGPGPRIVVRQMEKFEPLLASKVSEPGDPGGLNKILKPGMRAFTIRVDNNSGMFAAIRAGDRIDVFWTGSARATPDGTSEEVTRLIESNVEVVAVDAKLDGDSVGAVRTLTVSVSPQQVARLAQAQTTGRLAMAMIGLSDTGDGTVVDPTDQCRLLGTGCAEAPGPVAEAPKQCFITQRNGAERVQVEIPCPTPTN